MASNRAPGPTANRPAHASNIIVSSSHSNTNSVKKTVPRVLLSSLAMRRGEVVKVVGRVLSVDGDVVELLGSDRRSARVLLQDMPPRVDDMIEFTCKVDPNNLSLIEISRQVCDSSFRLDLYGDALKITQSNAARRFFVA